MNRKGFTIVEILLLIFILMALGGVGWFVWNSKHNTDKSFKNSGSASSSTYQYVTLDPETDWTLYTNTVGLYRLRHPPSWVRAANLDSCNPGLFMIGHYAKDAGICGSESFGEMTVYSSEGDHRDEAELRDGYSGVVRVGVTVDGVTGYKMTGAASGQRQESEIGTVGLEDGTQVTKYFFYTNGRTYTATFVESTPPSGVLDDFNTMVTRTLRFSLD